MKAFSVKALILTALVVVSSPANADDIIDTIHDYIKKADRALFGRCIIKRRVEGGVPVFNSYLYCENGYARAAVVVVTIFGIYKVYRYLTKPDTKAADDKKETI